MDKPYVVCHMVESLDGRIDCHMVDHISGDEYEETLKSYKCPSFLNGRVTMARYWAEKKPFVAKDSPAIGKKAVFVAEPAPGYAVSVDTQGMLRFKTNRVENLPLICLVSEQASVAYLDYLKSKKISYIAVGKKAIDFKRALALLKSEFGIARLALLGGGLINGAFLKAGLIDEISMLVAPGLDARQGRVAAFDGLPDVNRAPYKLTLKSCKAFKNDVVWLKYKFS